MAERKKHMIRYYRLFDLLNRRGIKLYMLGEILSTKTIAKLSKGENIETNTICKICEYLNCNVEDIMEYIPNKKQKGDKNENDWFENIFLPNLKKQIENSIKYKHTMILSNKQEKVCKKYMYPTGKNKEYRYKTNDCEYILYYYNKCPFLKYIKKQ